MPEPRRPIDPQLAEAQRQRQAQRETVRRAGEGEREEPSLALVAAYAAEAVGVLSAWLRKRKL